MPRKYQKLEKTLRQVPSQTFTHLFVRFGFTDRHITYFWQSEIVQMAFRNYLAGVIDIEYFYTIVYEWIENNKFEYGRKQYKIFIYQVVREIAAPQPTEKKMGSKAFLYSRLNLI